MGPDEFHERLPRQSKAGLKDNAYTNFLIVWVMLKAQEMLTVLPKKDRERICRKLRLSQKKLNLWEDITRNMNIIINRDGIISQFDGYFGLKELNWETYKTKYGKIQRMDRILKAEGKSPNDYKIAKQADVLMLFYMLPLSEIRDIFARLGYDFDKNVLKKNYEYYIKRTSHGSTLSKVVHSYVSHLLGRKREAWKWFLEVLESDIYDTQGGTTREGIHAGVMGGSLNIAVKGFAGVNILNNRIRIAPRLPAVWNEIKLNFCCKGRWVALTVRRRQIIILVNGPRSGHFSIPIEIQDKVYSLRFGKIYKIPYSSI